MTEATQDPRELNDAEHPGGLVDGGGHEMPGVQDRGPSEDATSSGDQRDGPQPDPPVPDLGQDSSFSQHAWSPPARTLP